MLHEEVPCGDYSDHSEASAEGGVTGKILRWAVLIPLLAILVPFVLISGLMVVFFDDVNRMFGVKR